MDQQSPNVLSRVGDLDSNKMVLDVVELCTSLSLCLKPQVSQSSKEGIDSDVCVPAQACVCLCIYDISYLPQPFSIFIIVVCGWGTEPVSHKNSARNLP